MLIRLGGYETFNQYRKVWEEINGEWNPNDVVIVYEFKLVEAPDVKDAFIG